MFEYFYDKTITVLKDVGEVDDCGFYIKKLTNVEDIKVDIQPMLYKDKMEYYGIDIKSEKQMFTNYKFKKYDYIRYNDKEYQIEKVIEWDDYSMCALLEI